MKKPTLKIEMTDEQRERFRYFWNEHATDGGAIVAQPYLNEGTFRFGFVNPSQAQRIQEILSEGRE
jgi:hypothetical protein